MNSPNITRELSQIGKKEDQIHHEPLNVKQLYDSSLHKLVSGNTHTSVRHTNI